MRHDLRCLQGRGCRPHRNLGLHFRCELLRQDRGQRQRRDQPRGHIQPHHAVQLRHFLEQFLDCGASPVGHDNHADRPIAALVNASKRLGNPARPGFGQHQHINQFIADIAGGCSGGFHAKHLKPMFHHRSRQTGLLPVVIAQYQRLHQLVPYVHGLPHDSTIESAWLNLSENFRRFAKLLDMPQLPPIAP